MMAKARTMAACEASAIRGLYADLLPTVTIKAWRWRGSDAVPLAVTTTDIDEALAETAPQCWHKDHLAILHGHDGRGKKTLRIYAIKQKSKAIYRRNPSTGVPEPFRELYADLVMEMQVEAFAPVEMWRWEPGADVVGIDRTLVDHRHD